MESRGVVGILCQMLFFISALLPCAVTGVELAINGISSDHSLQTVPGMAQSLWCAVQNHSQEEELLWFRESGAVSLKDGNKMNVSSLCISPVTVDDNGVSFTCRLARDGSIQVSVVLNVIFPPILQGDDLSLVEEESDVTLDCHTKANPLAQMTWLKDNDTLTLENSRHQVFQTSELFQLKILGALKSDSGEYICMAESPLGTERKSFQLVVRDKTVPFPTEAVIAAAVVVLLTIIFAITARRERIFKCLKKPSESPSNTKL